MSAVGAVLWTVALVAAGRSPQAPPPAAPPPAATGGIVAPGFPQDLKLGGGG